MWQPKTFMSTIPNRPTGNGVAGRVASADASCLELKRGQCQRDILNQFTAQRGTKGLCIWGPSFTLPTRVQLILLMLDQPGGPDVEVLKRSVRRSVLRVHDVTPELRSLIVKGFPLARIISRMKYRKFRLHT